MEAHLEDGLRSDAEQVLERSCVVALVRRQIEAELREEQHHSPVFNRKFRAERRKWANSLLEA